RTSNARTSPCCAPRTCRRCWSRPPSCPTPRKRSGWSTRSSRAPWRARSSMACTRISPASRRRARCMPRAPRPARWRAPAAARNAHRRGTRRSDRSPAGDARFAARRQSFPDPRFAHPLSRPAGARRYHAQVPIQPLPDTLINQIAAGEVVERPASVVKELVENALDVGATRIDLDLEEGGVRLIRVRDDGGGMPADELPLAVSRHATSKIASLDDLESVATLGFRGEALPSIASVSRMRLATRRPADAHGAELLIEGGRVGEVAPRSHPPGTTVEVRDLFYNVPARRKFLRAERTELGHIEEWLRSLALARPDVELRVSHNGKASRRYRAFDRSGGALFAGERLLETLGEEFSKHALRIEHEGAGLRLHGWIAQPAYSRASADQQYLYVNGRPVRDRSVA